MPYPTDNNRPPAGRSSGPSWQAYREQGTQTYRRQPGEPGQGYDPQPPVHHSPYQAPRAYGANAPQNYGFAQHSAGPGYSTWQSRDRQEQAPAYDSWEGGYTPAAPAEEVPELTEDEQREVRKDRLRVLFGLMDFFGVVIGAVVILLLIALLVSLINFVKNDLGLSADWLLKVL